MTDVNNTDPVVAAGIRRATEVDGVSAPVRDMRATPQRAVGPDGDGIPADRISVASARYTERIEGLRQSAANASRAATSLDLADRALSRIDFMLGRMAELAETAAGAPPARADGSPGVPAELSVRERALLDGEFVALRSGIDRLVDDTNLHGVDLAGRSPASARAPLESFGPDSATRSAGAAAAPPREARAAALSADLGLATLAGEASATEAVIAVAEARRAADGLRTELRSVRAGIDSMENAAGEISAVVSGARDDRVAPETLVDLSRRVADRIAQAGGVRLAPGAEKILQDVLLRASASTSSGGPASGGDGLETLGGRTSGTPAASLLPRIGGAVGF